MDTKNLDEDRKNGNFIVEFFSKISLKITTEITKSWTGRKYSKNVFFAIFFTNINSNEITIFEIFLSNFFEDGHVGNLDVENRNFRQKNNSRHHVFVK